MSTLIGLAAGAAISAGSAAIRGGSVGDILKSAGIGAATGAVTGGVGSMAGASATGVIGKAAQALGGKMSSSSFSLLSNAGKSLASVGGKMASFGAEQGVKATLEGLKTELGSKTLKQGVNEGLTEGAGTAIQNPAQAPTSGAPATPGGAPSATTTNIPGSAGTTPATPTTTTGATGAAKGSTAQATSGKTPTSGAPELKSATGKGTVIKDKIVQGTKKAAGQIGVQGALSIASGIQAGKQAKAANEVSRQGLLFQQQTYNEQITEREKTKAKLKTDAQTAYKSATLFGETLTKSTPSENLLTSYTSGNTGSYSIFNTGLSVKKSTDLT